MVAVPFRSERNGRVLRLWWNGTEGLPIVMEQNGRTECTKDASFFFFEKGLPEPDLREGGHF